MKEYIFKTDKDRRVVLRQNMSIEQAIDKSEELVNKYNDTIIMISDTDYMRTDRD